MPTAHSKELARQREVIASIRHLTDKAAKHRLAAELVKLANALRDLEAFEEALGVVNEVIEVEALITASSRRPERTQYILEYLSLKAALYNNLNRGQAALETSREMVERARQSIFEAHGLLHLVDGLEQLADNLDRCDQLDEALSTRAEIVRIYRLFAWSIPHPFTRVVPNYATNLAVALRRQAVSLWKTHHCEEALEQVSEAVEIHQKLMALKPDWQQHELAYSLKSQSIFLWELGQKQRGLWSMREAVRLQKNVFLWQKSPAALRGMMQLLSRMLTDVGRHREAKEISNEAQQLDVSAP